MRITGFFVMFMLAVALTCSAAPICEIEDIFAPITDTHVHGSSIVQCPNGDLLVAWFHGSGERTADDVVVNGARKKAGESTWSPIFQMADTPDFPDCNPVLYIDQKERLWLFWLAVQANRWECGLLKYRRAEDYQGTGVPVWSWQDVINLKPGQAFADALEKDFEALGMGEGMWGEYAPPYTRMLLEAAQDPYKRQVGWMPRIHPLTLPSGRILLPLYSDGFNVSLVAISDDIGETWRSSLPIVGAGPTQPTFALRQNGDIVAFLRDSGESPMRVQISTSTDNGESWSPSTDTRIPNPDSSLEALVLDSGAWLLILNDTSIGRMRLSAWLSEDEGKTWTWKRQVEPSETLGSSFAYPSVIQSSDGNIHISYSYRSKEKTASIRHCTLNEAWIKSGK